MEEVEDEMCPVCGKEGVEPGLWNESKQTWEFFCFEHYVEEEFGEIYAYVLMGDILLDYTDEQIRILIDYVKKNKPHVLKDFEEMLEKRLKYNSRA